MAGYITLLADRSGSIAGPVEDLISELKSLDGLIARQPQRVNAAIALLVEARTRLEDAASILNEVAEGS